MITEWKTLTTGQQLLYVWGIGTVLMSLGMSVYILMEYYHKYVSFIKSEERQKPDLFDNDPTGALFVFALVSAFWPITLIVTSCNGFFNEGGPFKLLRYLNPRFLVERLAVKRHKALIVTSPDERVRDLLK